MWRSRLEEDRGGRMRRRMEAEVDRGGTEGMKCRKMEVEEDGKWRRRRRIEEEKDGRGRGWRRRWREEDGGGGGLRRKRIVEDGEDGDDEVMSLRGNAPPQTCESVNLKFQIQIHRFRFPRWGGRVPPPPHQRLNLNRKGQG